MRRLYAGFDSMYRHTVSMLGFFPKGHEGSGLEWNRAVFMSTVHRIGELAGVSTLEVLSEYCRQEYKLALKWCKEYGLGVERADMCPRRAREVEEYELG